MALIAISNLKPAGSDLFADPESFLIDLQETDCISIRGGGNSPQASTAVASMIPVPTGGTEILYTTGATKSKAGTTFLFYTSTPLASGTQILFNSTGKKSKGAGIFFYYSNNGVSVPLTCTPC